jgi:N utilization substance protein B
VLFAADLRGIRPERILQDGTFVSQVLPSDHARRLIEGVAERRSELDEAIATHLAEGWTIARMPRVDRNLARLAAFEILDTDTPAEVAISEAVALAAELSTDASAGFLSGVLGALAKEVSRRSADTAQAGGPDGAAAINEELINEELINDELISETSTAETPSGEGP